MNHYYVYYKVARELQEIALGRRDHEKCREKTTFRRAPAGEHPAIRRQVLDVVGELRVKERTRIRTCHRQ